MRVHHLAVRARDLGRAEAFYAGVLGLRVIRRFDYPEGTPRSFWVELGDGAFLAVEQAENDGARRDDDPGHHCVSFAIALADRADWRARLEAAGHPVERETPFTLYCRDPDGAVIGLSHHPEPDPLAD